MAYLLKIKSPQEIAEVIEEKNLEISKEIVNVILENLDSEKQHIPTVQLVLEPLNEVVDITMEKKNFIYILEKNLKIHESHEYYEGCSKIVKAIKYLKNK